MVATAANLLKQHPTEEEEQISRLIDCDENNEGADDDDHRQDNLLERRMRSRGDLSSLYDPHYGNLHGFSCNSSSLRAFEKKDRS